MREHGQRDVPVPAGVASDLVMIQPGLALGGLEALLDSPPGAGHAHHLGQAHPPRGVAPEIGDIRWIVKPRVL